MVSLCGINIPKRLFSRRLLALVIIVMIAIWAVRKYSNTIENDEEWYKHPFVHLKRVSCDHDPMTLRLYEELTERLVAFFTELELTYFLCYGSLWGALKFKRTLPWDRNIDMCAVYQQFMRIDEHKIKEAFMKCELRYHYNHRRGKYVVKYKTVSAEITLFEKIDDHMERVGWEKRLFPQYYLNYQNFPTQLIENEMPKLLFNTFEVRAPHLEYELQKYLYPENWWKEVKPRGCKP
jgi:phosphorylcholine metabolism protein LicD